MVVQRECERAWVDFCLTTAAEARRVHAASVRRAWHLAGVVVALGFITVTEGLVSWRCDESRYYVVVDGNAAVYYRDLRTALFIGALLG